MIWGGEIAKYTLQDICDAFALWFSGAGEMIGGGEMWFENGIDLTTIQFPTKSPNKAIVRYIWDRGIVVRKETYVNGLLHGKQYNYFCSGKLDSIQNYKNGKKEGSYVGFSSRGRLKEKLKFRDDELVERTEYQKNGSVGYYCRYFSGHGDKKVIFYDKKGIISSKHNYKKYKMHGKQTYYQNGKIHNTQYYEDGKRIKTVFKIKNK